MMSTRYRASEAFKLLQDENIGEASSDEEFYHENKEIKNEIKNRENLFSKTK